MSEKNYCKKCGSELKPGVKFCGQCGTPVTSNIETDTGEDINTEKDTATNTAASGTTAETASGAASDASSTGQVRPAKLKKWRPFVIIIVAAVVILIAVIFIVRSRLSQEDVYMDYSYTDEEPYTEYGYAEEENPYSGDVYIEEEPYTDYDYTQEDPYTDYNYTQEIPDTELSTEDDLYIKYGILSGNDFSDDDLVKAARNLYTELYQAAYDSHEAYADLIIGGTYDEIEDFRWGYSFSTAQNFDHFLVTIVLKEDPYYLVQVDAFLITHTYGDSEVLSLDQKYLMSYTSDGWKINYTDEARDFVNSPEMLDKRYPEGMVDAVEAGRNAEAFDRCYLWLNNADEFDDMVCADTLFLWQNEDGSVDAMIWLANGSNQPRTFNNEHLTVTDGELGTVIDFDLSTAGERVEQYSSMLKTIHINAEDVETGTQAWTDIDAELSVDYDTGLNFSWP